MKITLPDNSSRELPEGSSGYDLAKDIGPGLAKSAIAVTIDGVQKDLYDVIDSDASVSIITIDSDEGVEIMRHTLTAQVLARAIKNLYPESKLAIGPTVKDGFYYDVESDQSISSDDLSKIEEEMKKIIKTKSAITKKLVSRKEALKIFKSNKEPYKEIIINESDQDDDFQLYYQDDEEFVDLCKGPHLPNLGFIGSFKLTKVSGAYWRGDSNNEMLQRIYGTCWSSKKELENYLLRLEEAEKRDHRKLGKEMDLFHFREESPGAVFWHEKGWNLFQRLIEYMRLKQRNAGYKEINTPELLDKSLWEKSGHWDKFGDLMFTSETPDEKIFAVKPMNCPGCIQVFNQGLKSYRDLPLKLSEFGKVHRYEPSGALHGLLRVRAFTQDDAHIFCLSLIHI